MRPCASSRTRASIALRRGLGNAFDRGLLGGRWVQGRIEAQRGGRGEWFFLGRGGGGGRLDEFVRFAQSERARAAFADRAGFRRLRHVTECAGFGRGRQERGRRSRRRYAARGRREIG